VLSEWVLASPHGTLVVANNTSHTIPREDPALIVSAVERLLAALR
jgi:pimeloyl-ACP methyl ester carboxylesterase